MHRFFVLFVVGWFAVGCGSGVGDPDALPAEVDLTCPRPALSPEPATPGFFAFYTALDGVEDMPAQITGPYADVVVNVEQAGGRLVFSRATSYRPVWITEDAAVGLPHLAEVRGPCPADERFDRSNAYAWARVLSESADEIRVGWRYAPVLDGTPPDAFVHEVWSIDPSGRVTRVHRPTTPTITAWRDPNHRTVQTLQLSAQGVDVLETTAPMEPSAAPAPDAAPVVDPAVAPVLHWRFDEGQGDVTRDAVSGRVARIDGQGAPWRPGVSGHALAFDGYTASVRVDGDPDLSFDRFTVSARVALGARPWSEAAVVRTLSDGAPVVLGVDPHGRPWAMLGGAEVRGDDPIALSRWTHLAAAFDGETLALTVDGEPIGQVAASAPDVVAGLQFGMNVDESPASDAVRWDDTGEFHHFANRTGIEGWIDEVMIHDRALDDVELAMLADPLVPVDDAAPVLPPRHTPGPDGVADRFGAVLDPLRWHPLWDDLWRVEEGDDVVVRFDDRPGAFVYWRGTVHGMNAVADVGRWMTDQSVEMVVPERHPTIRTLAEHMSDKAARRSHVRVIENTDARVVVHWRYATTDVFDTNLHQRGYVDELHTIYPDGVAVRQVRYWLVPEEPIEFFHDFQVLLEPGQRAEDVVPWTAVTYANLAGDTADLTWPIAAEARPPINPSNIVRINFDGPWDVVGIAQGGRHFPAGGGGEISDMIGYHGEDFPFAGPWNHWPAAQIPSDGRFATTDDRIAHFALGSLEPQEHGTGSMLYALTDDPTMAGSIALARSWVRPPELRDVQGATSQGYVTDARAWHLETEVPDVSFTLDASDASPVHNAAFVLAGWSGAVPSVWVDGAPVPARVGMTRDTAGAPQAVVFVPIRATTPIAVQIAAER